MREESKPGSRRVGCVPGHGLPERHRQQVFERFWRAPDARALPGSGLGLAIVADTVAAHGGTVRFIPAGQGATVRIELPTTSTDETARR
ncbi:sensor histidine kinase [Amycolatopsis lurida]